jgi:hypothetical protein
MGVLMSEENDGSEENTVLEDAMQSAASEVIVEETRKILKDSPLFRLIVGIIIEAVGINLTINGEGIIIFLIGVLLIIVGITIGLKAIGVIE